jgi:putative redox protein
MGFSTITWVQGKQFIGVDSTKHSVVMSSADEGIGMKPSELVLVALGGCTSYDVVNILGKRRVHLTNLEVQVTGEQSQDPPWAFTQIHVHYKACGVNLDPAEVEKAVKLSKEKYCSVSATLEKSVQITYDIEVLEDSGPQ